MYLACASPGRIARHATRPVRLALVLLTVDCAAPLASFGAVCTVPSGGYPTIAAALADATCDPIQIAAGSYTTNLSITRDVTLTGAGSASTTIAGWVGVSGAATDAVLNALRIDATTATSSLCYASGLDVRGGAKAGGVDLVVVGRPTPITPCSPFSDGFETGDLSAWSTYLP